MLHVVGLTFWMENCGIWRSAATVTGVWEELQNSCSSRVSFETARSVGNNRYLSQYFFNAFSYLILSISFIRKASPVALQSLLDHRGLLMMTLRSILSAAAIYSCISGARKRRKAKCCVAHLISESDGMRLNSPFLQSRSIMNSLLLTSTPLSRCKYAPGEGHLSSRGLIYPLSLPFGERS